MSLPPPMDESDYDPIEAGGVGAELIHFFLQENAKPLSEGSYLPKTLNDFLDACPQRHRDWNKNLGLEVRRYCHNLMAEALLYPAGFDPDQEHERPYNERFISFTFFKDLAAYGAYDFVALGRTEIRRHFELSVIRLGVSVDNVEKEMWGTAFLLEGNRLATACHCLPEGSRVTIEGWNPNDARLEKIKTLGTPDTSRPFCLTRSKIDLAILEFANDPFPSAHKFHLGGAYVLDDVLVMGYPQMMGFPPRLIAGTGQIIGEHMSTARNQPLILVDARMKGGNSGGPVLNQLGKVLGVVTNALTDEEQNIDKLGYGLATSTEALEMLIKACDEGSEDIYEIPHEVTDGVIRIHRR